MVDILIVDDDLDLLEVMSTALARPDRRIECAPSGESAITLSRSIRQFDVVLTDLNLKSSVSGLDILKSFKAEHPATRVILMSGFSTLDSAVEGVRAGALDFKEQRVGQILDQATRSLLGCDSRVRFPTEARRRRRTLVDTV